MAHHRLVNRDIQSQVKVECSVVPTLAKQPLCCLFELGNHTMWVCVWMHVNN